MNAASHETPKAFDKKKAAVALKYDRAADSAPMLVAKGRGAIAAQIIALALEKGIEIKEDADLVAVLEQLDLDTPIPVAAYAAVAEILSYVYRVNARAREKMGPMNLKPGGNA